MPDYSKGKIYTIRNRNDDTKIYVGSTIQPLAVRFGGHKKDSKTEKCINYKLYVEVANDWTNWYIELYENYPCNDKNELNKKEGEIQRLFQSDNNYSLINKKITNKSRQENNKEYRERYKYKIKEQKKQYRIDNTEKLKEQQKQYYIDNAEKLKEQKKQYRIDNAEKLKEKITCECGCEICKRFLSTHETSQKHIRLMEQLQQSVSS